MELIGILGLSIAAGLLLKWVLGGVLYIIYFIVGDLGKHLRGERGCYRNEDDRRSY